MRSIDADNDSSVMRAAVSHRIRGIAAECGGNGICATCHVYVEEAWLKRLGPISEDEDALLDSTASARLPSSRLSCQIRVTPALDGLTLRLPERQV
jgi:2Fe-2S ferredoxin